MLFARSLLVGRHRPRFSPYSLYRSLPKGVREIFPPRCFVWIGVAPTALLLNLPVGVLYRSDRTVPIAGWRGVASRQSCVCVLVFVGVG